MNLNEIQEAFFDNSIRPEIILHLGTQCLDDYSWPEHVKDAFDDDFEQVFEALGIAPPEEDEDEIWMLEEHLRSHGKRGYLVQFGTPVPTSFTEGGYSTSSWGYYTTKWIYADDYESACEAAIKWQNEYIERKRADAA